MAFSKDGYYYDQQIRSYILQFMAIFTEMQVQIGARGTDEPQLIPVPIHYAASDRVAAAIIAGNTQNSPVRVPVMSAYLRAMSYDPIRTAGQGNVMRDSFVPVGGMLPEDGRVVYNRKALPITLSIDLHVYASNHDQHFQILEQISPLFEPDLMVQTSDSVFDPARQATVRLMSHQMDSNYPIGTDRRIIQSTYSFDVLGWISLPANVRKNLIERVYVRVGAVSTGNLTSEQIISELDAGGFQYDLVEDAADLDIGDHPTNPS